MGQRLGEWVLEAPLGRGAYAEVWRARHNALPDRRAALKVPHDPAWAELLRSEGVLQQRLTGEHLVEVLGLDPEHDPPYLVVALVEGGSLRARIDAGPTPPAEALRLVAGIARGLAEAHAQGVVHRDLKPENVLLTADGQPRIADFGLGLTSARPPDELLSASLQTGRAQELAGTLRYMAPEQREPEGEVDARADLYALGVVLFELLTGEAPCGGEVPSDVLPGLDPRLDALYRRLCARLPGRVASAGALLEELGPLQEAPPDTPPDPSVAGAARCVDVPAGLSARALAFGLDLVPFLLLASLPFGRGRLLALPLLAAFVLYDLVAVTATGRTLGKRLCRLRITDREGRRVEASQALLREALRLVSLASLGLGYLPVLIGWRSFHDAFAGTRVLHDR